MIDNTCMAANLDKRYEKDLKCIGQLESKALYCILVPFDTFNNDKRYENDLKCIGQLESKAL